MALTPTLREGERWVSCARETNETVASARHIVHGRGEGTTLCGATGLGLSVWRGNTIKPPCRTCSDKRRPHRVQRTRDKGGGIPDGAVYVGRPSRWGNPFGVEKAPNWPRWGGIAPWEVVTDDGRVWDWPEGDEPPRRAVVFNQPPDWIDGNLYLKRKALNLAVHLFGLHVGPLGDFEYDADTLADLRATLGGRNLACWCPRNVACHADHLLDLANPQETTP